MTPAGSDLKPKSGDGTENAATGPLSAADLRQMDAYWRASNYLSVGQIYLLDKLIEHKEYISQFGDDMPAISGWKWGLKGPAGPGRTSTEGDNV
jgi:phosphoketolase